MNNFKRLLEQELNESVMMDLIQYALNGGVAIISYAAASALANIIDIDDDYEGFWVHTKVKNFVKNLIKGRKFIKNNERAQKELDEIKKKLKPGEKAWLTQLQKRAQKAADENDKMSMVSIVKEVESYLKSKKDV